MAKCYRTLPPPPRTGYAAVVAHGLADENLGRYRSSGGSTAIVAAASIQRYLVIRGSGRLCTMFEIPQH